MNKKKENFHFWRVIGQRLCFFEDKYEVCRKPWGELLDFLVFENGKEVKIKKKIEN